MFVNLIHVKYILTPLKSNCVNPYEKAPTKKNEVNNLKLSHKNHIMFSWVNLQLLKTYSTGLKYVCYVFVLKFNFSITFL